MFKRPSVHYGRKPEPETPYQSAAQVWDERIGSARVQARNWRLMAFGCLFLSEGLPAGLVWQSAQGTIMPWVVQVDKSRPGPGGRAGERLLSADRSADRLSSRALHRGGAGIPADAIIVRQNWLRAYDFTTDRGAAALNDYARTNDPFAKVGKMQVAIEISSVIRASPASFRVAWIERRYAGRLARRDRALDRDPYRRVAAPARRRPPPQEPARNLRQRHQLVEGAWIMTPPLPSAPPPQRAGVRLLA